MIKRGDIYYADLRPTKGSEQSGVRPVLIIQNDEGNAKSSTVIVAAISSRSRLAKFCTHYRIQNPAMGPFSTVMLEQIRTIDKLRLKEYMAQLDSEEMQEVDKRLRLSLNLK